MTPPTSAPPTTRFVARTPTAWHLFDHPAAAPRTIELAELIDLIEPAPLPPEVAADGAGSAPVEGTLIPVWCFVARLELEGLVVESGAIGMATLGPDHLVLIDAIGEGCAASALDELVGEPATATLRELLDLGVVAVTADVSPPHPPASAPGPELGVHPDVADSAVAADPPAARGRLDEVADRLRTAYRLSSKLAPLRRRLERDHVSAPTAAPLAASDVELPAPPPVEEQPIVGAPARPDRPSDDPALALHPVDPVIPGRVPVYSVWHRSTGPPLSLGMLTAAARAHGDGALVTSFEIRRPETADSFLADLRGRSGPAIVLLSDYVWSLADNLAVAAAAREIRPEILIVHGGPSCPKYEADAAEFLDAHRGAVDVMVRGEGEVTVCELLAVLAEHAADGSWPPPLEALDAVAGLTFRSPVDGRPVRTAERDRIADLDLLPSPYLTGEFDHIEREAWPLCLSIESNRGCPYGCTFCDWGSATMSRIRKFDLERVKAEIDWVTDRRISSFMIADANFGIMKRDVEVARHVADRRRSTGFPERIALTPAKNTVKHLVPIMDTLVAAGISPTLSISLQTVDEETLAAIERSNISIEAYLRLAADYRRRGLPLIGDLLVGIPGQTYETYRTDLQFNLDHEILVRTWPVQLLPNAPMNAPDYREAHDIHVDEHNVVVATRSFGRRDREAMFRLRRLFVTFEVFGLVRHLTRYLQWDHGIRALDVMDDLIRSCDEDPERFPLLSWIVSSFDLFPAAPVGWPSVYAELIAYLRDAYGIESSSGLQAVVDVQLALLPAPGRRFPVAVDLSHDYQAYYDDATRELYGSGHATGPTGALEAYPPATLMVHGDPLDLCHGGPRLAGDTRDEVMQGDFYMASTTAYELDSDLVRLLPHVVASFPRERIDEVIADRTASMSAVVEPSPVGPLLQIRGLSGSGTSVEPLHDPLEFEDRAREPLRTVGPHDDLLPGL